MIRPALLAALVTPVVVAATALVAAPPAAADARVTVTNDRGGSDADTTYRTTLRVRGTGFQSVRGGFGGVYVMFGWVDDPLGGSWKPSRGGLTGQDYRYVPDAEDAADNQGYLKFVAFPGSSTASEAAAVLRANGTFTVETTVPGPVFQSVDRDGDVAEVDCREVTCGVITIGAHGVKNPENETFTPVSFGTVYDSAPQEPTDSTDTAVPGTADPADGTDFTGNSTGDSTGDDVAVDAATPTKRVRVGALAVTVDRTTAVTGHALAFTARGFTPGEQVVAVLDDGVAALGPMVAGASGEVAGVLQLSAAAEVGTHELRLTGAASGAEVSELFPVAGATPADTAAEPVAAGEDDGLPAGALVLTGAAVVFLVSLVAFLVRRRRARASRRATATATTSPVPV